MRALAILLLAAATATPAAAEPSPGAARPRLEATGPDAAKGGIKKKKKNLKRRADEDPFGDAGGSCGGLMLSPVCSLGVGGGGAEPPGIGGPSGGPRGPRRRLKKWFVDAQAAAGPTIGAATGAEEGADATFDLAARFEIREGIGFDADAYALWAPDGVLPTYAFHLSFGHVTKKLRVRAAAGARVLDFGDPDVAQIWGFETGPSLDVMLTKKVRWDAQVLYGQFPGSLVTILAGTGFSYGTNVAPRIGYRMFLNDGVDHGPEVGLAFHF